MPVAFRSTVNTKVTSTIMSLDDYMSLLAKKRATKPELTLVQPSAASPAFMAEQAKKKAAREKSRLANSDDASYFDGVTAEASSVERIRFEDTVSRGFQKRGPHKAKYKDLRCAGKFRAKHTHVLNMDGTEGKQIACPT